MNFVIVPRDANCRSWSGHFFLMSADGEALISFGIYSRRTLRKLGGMGRGAMQTRTTERSANRDLLRVWPELQ